MMLLSFQLKGFSQTLTNEMLDNQTARNQSWVSYDSDFGLFSVGDTLLLGVSSSKWADRYSYIYPYKYSGYVAMAAFGSPPAALNSANMKGVQIVVTGIYTKGTKKRRVVVCDFSQINLEGVMSNLCCAATRESLRIGELIVAGHMTKEMALEELKEAKDYLELGLITQEEFDSIKLELTPVIMGE